MRRAAFFCALVAAATGAVASPSAAAGAPAPHNGDRYSLVGGCFGLRSVTIGGLVAKSPGGGYRASTTPELAPEPFRMQATDLSRYLFYGRDRDFLAARDGPSDRVESAPGPSEEADWRVEDAGPGTFRIALPSAGKVLAASPVGGRLVLREASLVGDAALFRFEPADGCAVYPEAETNAVGEPTKGATPFGEVTGFLDAHIHMMAFEFLGGRAHCGLPWHRYGVTFAMVDCPDHEPGGAGAVAENALSYGTPARTHDTVGWPTFKDWPHHASLTHEQTYYKWLERAWRGGLRTYVNLLVDNAVLCEVYPYKRNSCNEMDGVRLQAKRIHELQDYIDAQEGGPGKGWFRIVRDPFEARRVINEGKLAVVLGIEVSKLFDCGLYDGEPECDEAQIDRQLDEVYRLGVRDMELVNKFDNALAGVAGDAGSTGVVVNNGNKIETNRYWQMESCDGHDGAHDRSQATTAPGQERDGLSGTILEAFGPPGAIAPIYGQPPHCNGRGLSELGKYLVRRMIEKKMIIDPDHLSVLARQQLLAEVEKARYSGIVSSHSWSTPDSLPRIYALGGVVTPYAGSSTSFVEAWRKTKPMRSGRFYFGFGYGADMNGFGSQGAPRKGENPVQYPFKSFDGAVTLERQRSGERVFDINDDGVAHYGLYPDWIEDLRKIAGDGIVADMARGSEAYLQMWERAEGISAKRCQPNRARVTRRGLGTVRLGQSSNALLRRAGQPERRAGRTWRYCAKGGRVTSVLSPQGKVGLAASTAPRHEALGIGTGDRARGARVRPAGGGASFVYGVRSGRVTYVAVASREVARNPKRLRSYLKLAGLR